jgi:hypothetical protein
MLRLDQLGQAFDPALDCLPALPSGSRLTGGFGVWDGRLGPLDLPLAAGAKLELSEES